MSALRIVHLSILHKPLDTRIFRKECRALAAAGYEVHLVAAAPPADEVDGVTFHSVSRDRTRPPARRQWARQVRAARHAFRLRASVYHLQEPHLIPLGLCLKLVGARIVYDVHEDYPAHARSKLFDRPLRGRVKALGWRALEAVARVAFDGFVCASPALARGFPADRTVVVGNFPLHRELEAHEAEQRPYGERPNVVVYVGAISEGRAVRETLAALDLLPPDLDCRLRTIGEFRHRALEDVARSHGRVDVSPWRPHPGAARELTAARVGLALLYPLSNHVDPIRSNKLFEYMAAGLPVIASDMPRWRELVQEVGCGVVVDPHDPHAIAGAISYLLDHPDEAEAMGRRGQEAVRAELNWDGEEGRLLALYRGVAGEPPAVPRRLSAEQPASA